MRSDYDIIAGFEWVDDDTPLPVNPDDPDEVAAALEWAKREYKRYDSEYFLAENECGWYPGDAAELLRSDRDALGEFKAALMRTLYTMHQKDQQALTAWVNSEPIHAEGMEIAL